MINYKLILCYLAIIVVTYLVFQNSLSNEFVFDDESVVLGNASIQDVSNIPKFFTAEEGFHKVIGRYYRPVVSASYAIDYYFWELDPYGFHLTNVIIHIIACLLLFKIFITLFWRYKYRNLFSLLSTLIFAVHPIHTEAVSWVSGRTDSLVTLFFFASFLFYIQFTQEMEYDKKQKVVHKNKNYLFLYLSLLMYVFGLLSKEMIVTMPVIIFLYDFVYRKKDTEYFKKNMINYVLFIGVTVIYLIARYLVLADVEERISYLYFLGKDYVVVIGTMLKTIPVYFKLLFLPYPLLYHYNGVIPDARSIIDGDVIFSIIFVAIMLFLAYYFYKKDSIVSFCILFFFVSLLPVMNIVPTMNLMAERFLYYSSFALALLVCHLAMIGSTKRDFSFLTIGMCIFIALLSFLTFKRNLEWKDNDSLYLSAKGINGTVLLVNEGNIYANKKKYDEAAELYKRAIEIRYNNVLAHHNLGLIYLLEGKLDSAQLKFKAGIAIDSLAPDGYFQMATLYNMQNNPDSAIYMLEKLQTIAPNYKESAAILEKVKRGESPDNRIPLSVTGDETANIQIQMLQKSSYQNFTEKNYTEAINDLKKLIALNTDPVTISGFLNNIAMCYSEMDEPELEEKYFLDAIVKDDNNLNALNGLIAFYLKKADDEKAKKYLSLLLTVNPGDELAKKRLDSLNNK